MGLLVLGWAALWRLLLRLLWLWRRSSYGEEEMGEGRIYIFRLLLAAM